MRRSVLWAVSVALFLAAYGALLVRANSAVAGGADSSGYLNAARLYSRGRVSEPIALLSALRFPPADQEMFFPLGYRAGPRPGTMAPSYPPGLPLHMALAGMLGGWSFAPFLVVPLLAVASLVLLFLVARELGLSRGLASTGAVLLAACPIFFGIAIQPMSDVPATAWVLAVILFALRARRRPAWAFAAGAAYGIAVLVRPTNVLIGLALLFALPRGTRAVARAFAGALPFAAFLLLYNYFAFGDASMTGHGAHGEKMSANNVLAQIRIHGSWIPSLLTPLVPLAWIAVGFDRRVPRRDRWLLLAWFGAFFGFYCFNEVLEDWWVTRYLLPGIPAMILATLLLARDASERIRETNPLPATRRWVTAIGCVVLGAIVAVGIRHIRRFDLLSISRGEAVYRDAGRGVADIAPSRAVILSMQMSGALKYYTDYPIVRWDWMPAERFPKLRRAAEERGLRLYALLWPFEHADSFAKLPGSWTRVGAWRDVVLWRLD